MGTVDNTANLIAVGQGYAYDFWIPILYIVDVYQRMTGPDYIVEIDGISTPTPQDPPVPKHSLHRRPWLAVMWRCCSCYSRIYRNPDANAYEGRCPKCNRPVRMRIGPDGTANRFFEAI